MNTAMSTDGAPLPGPVSVRVALPAPLRTLARISAPEVGVIVPAPATLRSVIDAIEQQWPMLRGTTRDLATGRRRAYVRFYAASQDLSNQPLDDALPASVQQGAEALLIIGAMSGG